MSMGVSFRSSLAGLWRADLAPLKQRTAESSNMRHGWHNKRIPCAARELAAKKLFFILEWVVEANDLASWDRLLHFSTHCLLTLPEGGVTTAQLGPLRSKRKTRLTLSQPAQVDDKAGKHRRTFLLNPWLPMQLPSWRKVISPVLSGYSMLGRHSSR